MEKQTRIAKVFAAGTEGKLLRLTAADGDAVSLALDLSNGMASHYHCL